MTAERGIPGYTTIAWNDESGRRGATIGLPTEAVEAIGAAFERLIELAVCTALGTELSPPTATTRSAGASDSWTGRLVDRRGATVIGRP